MTDFLLAAAIVFAPIGLFAFVSWWTGWPCVCGGQPCVCTPKWMVRKGRR